MVVEGLEDVGLLALAEGLNHALRQFVLAVCHLRVLPLVFAFVAEELPAGVQDVVAAGADAVDVVAHSRETTALEGTVLVLHELLEAVPVELLVLDVVGLVLLCKGTHSSAGQEFGSRRGYHERDTLTHVGLVLEGVLAVVSPTVEVRGTLTEEGAIRGAALLRGPESLEAFLYYGGVLTVVVGVHLHVRSADVDFVAALFDAVVMRLLAVVAAAAVPVGAVVHGGVPHEAVLQGLVALLVPLEVSYHLLLLDEHPGVAVQAVEVLPVVEVLAVGVATLDGAAEALHVARVVHRDSGLGVARVSARAQRRHAVSVPVPVPVTVPVTNNQVPSCDN